MTFQSPTGNPNFLQGSATAALTWVLYDVSLTWDRELKSVWKASWSVSKVLFILSRYHTLLALGYVSSFSSLTPSRLGTKHFALPIELGSAAPADPAFLRPCIENLKYSRGSRWYLGLTEVLSIMAGEFLILIRINAVYGWSRPIVIIGLTTTILSVSGGSAGLFKSSGILNCTRAQNNIPDVNFSSAAVWCTSLAVVCIYILLIIYKSKDVEHTTTDESGNTQMQKMGFFAAFKPTHLTPTLHVCLRDAAIYFLVILSVLLINLVLILVHNKYAQLGTAWLLATYSVASTRIFLNLKDLTEPGAKYNESTWSQFQQNSALNPNQIQAALGMTQTHTQPAPAEEEQPRPISPGVMEGSSSRVHGARP
ncbi:hypothetical protein C8F01DRAFT_1138019 [Mycena amicta]|nr:hypothetical protein C8F01DRAFT_1138019 [Mycena amicta]